MRKQPIEVAGPIPFAAKLQAWINTLPEFWQPIGAGASIIVMVERIQADSPAA